MDELSALEYISCEDRVHSSRTNFLMDVESGRRFVLEIGDFEVDSKEEEEDSKRREEEDSKERDENDETKKKKFVARPWLLFCCDDEEGKEEEEEATEIFTDRIELSSKCGIVSFRNVRLEKKSYGSCLWIRIHSDSLNESWTFPVKVEELVEQDEEADENS